MTAAELRFDEPRATLVQPGGGVLAADDDLFEIAADTPKLFVLRNPAQRVPQPAPDRQRLPSPARLRYGTRM
jgi:hypothetical protein